MIMITSDLHITDKPLDEYRWGIFQWLKQQLDHSVDEVDTVFILGDLTDAKDKHNSELVNRLVGELKSLSEAAQVYILKGNHDYIEETLPFFNFLSQVGSNIKFIAQPEKLNVEGFGVLCLPSSRNYQTDWQDFDFSKFDLIFTHQTYEGSVAENGSLLPGIPPAYFKGFEGKVISGDIHVPQKVSNNIQYVGAPYRIRFGDSFDPRVLMIAEGKIKSRKVPFMRRQVFNIKGVVDDDFLNEWNQALFKDLINEGDQVKVRVTLKRSDFDKWPTLKKTLRQHAQEQGWVLCGLELIMDKADTSSSEQSKISSAKTSKNRIEVYAKLKKLDVKLGLEFLQAGQNV